MSDDRPGLVEPRRVDNPFVVGEPHSRANGAGGLVSVEQQRAIAEVQARMIIARANPRDPIRAMEMITNDCCRPTLAQAATYTFQRGGTDIHGPTIRLLEAIAQRWGNVASGIKEISRHGEYSECVAYAWDLESGYYDERQFQIRHWRDTKQGGYVLRDERDIYELIANFGQRRKRAVLQTIVPGDVIEAALEQCDRTMMASADTTPEGIKKLVEAFAEFGVTIPQIEARIQRRLDAIRPAQIVALRKVFNSLRDGMSEPGDWFEDPRPPLAEAGAGIPAAETVTTPGQTMSPAAPARRPGRPRKDPAATPAAQPETSRPAAPQTPPAASPASGLSFE